jgi:hypothetical protein
MRGHLSARKIPCELNFDEVLRPADAFSHPQEVVCEPDLSINEKRAILASWASDACAVEAMPGFRRSSAGTTVTFDDIMDALKELDERARKGMKRTPKYMRLLRHGEVLS